MENDFEEKDFGEALTEFCLSMNHNKAKDEAHAAEIKKMKVVSKSS